MGWRVGLVLLAGHKAVFSRPFEGAEFVRQLAAIGAKSLALPDAATGVVLSLQTRHSFTRFGAKSLLPAVIVFSLVEKPGQSSPVWWASGQHRRRDWSRTGLQAVAHMVRVNDNLQVVSAHAL